jgi:heme-degrading monooxygenase HmoA
MLIRIATFSTAPIDTDERDWVIEALASVPGVRAAYHAMDRDTGALLSLSIFDDRDAYEAGFAAIAHRAAERGHQGVPPDETHFYEVVRFTENVSAAPAETVAS